MAKQSYEYISDIDETRRLIVQEKDPKKKAQLESKLERLQIGYEKAIEREVNKALRF